MSRTYKDSPHNKPRPANDQPGKRRRLTVRSERRTPPDLRRLGRAVRELAIAEAEAEAARQTQTAAHVERPSEEPEDGR